MEGQFLVRQIYEDEITYNLISAAVNRLSTYAANRNESRGSVKRLPLKEIRKLISAFSRYPR